MGYLKYYVNAKCTISSNKKLHIFKIIASLKFLTTFGLAKVRHI